MGLLELQQKNLRMFYESYAGFTANSSLGLFGLWAIYTGFFLTEDGLRFGAFSLFLITAVICAPVALFTPLVGARRIALRRGQARLRGAVVFNWTLLLLQIFVCFIVIRNETDEVTNRMTLHSLLCVVVGFYPGLRLTQIMHDKMSGTS